MNCVDDSVNSVDTSECCANLKIEDKVVKVQLDTGAKVNVISTKVLQDFASRYPFEKTQVKLKSYSGHQIPTKGVVTLPCECKGNSFQVNFHLVEMEAPTVLGAQTCKDLDLLVRVHPLQQQSLSTCPEEMAQTMYLFQGLGCLPGEHAWYSACFPQREIKEELDRMKKTE